MKYVLASLIALLTCAFSFAETSKGPPLLEKAQYDSLSADDKYLVDSLQRMHGPAMHDTVRLNLLVELSEKCDEQDILFFADPAQKLADQILKSDAARQNPALKVRVMNKKALALNNIGILYWQRGNVNGALLFIQLGMKIREQTNDTAGLSESLNNMGELYRLQGNIALALDFLNRSLKVREQIHDTTGIIICLNNLSLIYLQQEDTDRSLGSYNRALRLAEKINDRMNIGFILHNISIVYRSLKDTAHELEYQNRSLKAFKDANYKPGVGMVLNNMGSMYLARDKNSDKARECFTQSLQLWEKIGDVSNIAVTLASLGNLWLDKGEIDSAEAYGVRSLRSAYLVGYPERIHQAALLLYKVYKAQAEFKKAMEMHEVYVQMRDSIFNQETKKSTLKQQMKYEYEKEEALKNAEHQKELELADESKKRQQYVSYSIGVGLLMLSLFSLLLFKRLRITREQKQIIEEQKKTVDLKNRHITDSINYAKRIQDSILPSKDDMEKCFPEHFIFFQPADIVSGDFYWLAELPSSGGGGARTLLAVADCTGHGVPGALMSMIGNTLLNEIVNEQKIVQPAEILEHLNEGIIHALHQESRAQADGMDIALCLFEKDKLTFAGANHALYLADGKTLQKIEGDPIPIGNQFNLNDLTTERKASVFTQKTISLQKGMTVFMCTDGYYDQKGGKQGTKFMSKRFRELLENLVGYSAREQEDFLRRTFEEWKGTGQQIDDVLVVGIKC